MALISQMISLGTSVSKAWPIHWVFFIGISGSTILEGGAFTQETFSYVFVPPCHPVEYVFSYFFFLE